MYLHRTTPHLPEQCCRFFPLLHAAEIKCSLSPLVEAAAVPCLAFHSRARRFLWAVNHGGFSHVAWLVAWSGRQVLFMNGKSKTVNLSKFGANATMKSK
jgi:hypothetical protein